LRERESEKERGRERERERERVMGGGYPAANGKTWNFDRQCLVGVLRDVHSMQVIMSVGR